MPHDETVRTARKTSVGDQGHVVAKPSPHQRRGRREHLGHARAALRPLVANDHHIATLDRPLLERRQHRLLTVKHAGRPTEPRTFLAGDLGYGTARGEVAMKDRDVAGRLDRVLHRLNDLLPGGQPLAGGEVFRQRLAGDGHAIAVEQALVEQILHQAAGAADRVQVFLHVLAARLQVGEVGHPPRHPLEVGRLERHVHRAGHGDQVEHGVGGAAENHHRHDGVFKAAPGHDVAGLEVEFQKATDRRARPLALIELAPIFRRDRCAVGQRHPQGLDRRGHRVGRVHAAAGTGTGAGLPHDVAAAGIVDAAGDILAVALECRHDVERGAVGQVAGADRATIDHQGGAVEPPHGDQAARHILVAAGNGHQAVIPLGLHDGLDRVGDDVARRQRKAHAIGAHRDAVADADGVEPHAHHPGRRHALTHSRRQFVEVHVAGIALVPHAGDADLWFLEVGRLEAGAQEHGLRGPLRTGLGDPGAVAIQNGGGGRGRHGVFLGVWCRIVSASPV